MFWLCGGKASGSKLKGGGGGAGQSPQITASFTFQVNDLAFYQHSL